MKINLWFVKFNLSWRVNDLKIEFYGKRYLMLVGAIVHINWLVDIIVGI